ncbi:hypothetical protein STEG23_031939, partial [Scotinomys teguina]
GTSGKDLDHRLPKLLLQLWNSMIGCYIISDMASPTDYISIYAPSYTNTVTFNSVQLQITNQSFPGTVAALHKCI